MTYALRRTSWVNFAVMTVFGATPSFAGSQIREIEREILDAHIQIEESADTSEPPLRKPPRPARPARIPVEINKNVDKWIHYFTVQDRERFHRFLKRGYAYKPLVQEILQKNGVPRELYYLAMIESGYVAHATSRASAVGIWQFMRPTARDFGLRQSRELDERRDVVRATEAAAKFLGRLHRKFQSWNLALAAYNAGEGRIAGAVRRGRSRNFWHLVEQRKLPPETRNYVPKFFAALIIGKNPARYGFHDLDVPLFPEVIGLSVPGGIGLSTIAGEAGVSAPMLRNLNPQLLRGTTPSHFRKYQVWVPKTLSGRLALIERRLADRKGRFTRVIASSSASALRFHRVRAGENLTIIARRYGLEVAGLKRLNGLRTNRLLKGQRLKISGSAGKKRRRIVHRVRTGDALLEIASRYNVPMRRIKRLNELPSNRIYVGQRLVIARGN